MVVASLEGARVPMHISFSHAWDGIFDPLWKQVLIGGNGAKLGLSEIKSGWKSSYGKFSHFEGWGLKTIARK